MDFTWSEQQQTWYEASVSFALGSVIDSRILDIQRQAAPRVLGIARVLGG